MSYHDIPAAAFGVRTFVLVAALAITGAFSGHSYCQESSTSDEDGAPESTGDPYLDMRKSEDRIIKQYADRYFNLIKLQAWTSANGKSKVNAKYVSHDPDLKWVKLATVKGSGPNRVVKDVTVEVAKLNKACQSRVRQIATMQTKLDELAEAAEDDPATGASEYGRGSEGAPMSDETGNQPRSRYGGRGPEAPSEVVEEPDPAASAPAPAEQTPVIDPNDPDPLGFEEAAAQSPPVAMPAPGGGTYPSRYRGAPPADGPADPAQWTSSYPNFHANFAVTQAERGEPSIDWGQLDALRQMNDIATAAAHGEGDADAAQQQAAEIASAVGEIGWEAGFVGLEGETGDREVKFDLPPLPEPLKMRFLLDPQESLEAWSTLPPGQRVHFAGRLSVETPNEIIVRVRMADAAGSELPPYPRPGSR